MNNAATLSMVVEDTKRAPLDQMVGIAQVVFITEWFVQWVKTTPAPWANAHAARPLPDSSWPLLGLEGVGKANAQDGVNVLVTRWETTHSLLPEDEHRVREYLSRQFVTYRQGYNFKEILLEANGEVARRRALNTGFRVRNDYAAFFHDNPTSVPQDKRPCLLGLTREEALADEGSFASHVFAYTPPRFFFKPHEQDLLLRALMGATDEEIAPLLEVTPSALKKRWLGIFARVAEVDPGLLPDAAPGGGRGAEKRTTLLRYLRDHREELRPIQSSPERKEAGRRQHRVNA